MTLWQDGPQRSELTYNEHAQLATLKTASPERPGPTREAALALQSREQQLRYDPFGRLRQVQEGPLAQGFEYDANGNRLGQSSPTLGSLRYVLAGRSDRLLAVENAQGQGQRRYHHNSAGEPIRIESNGDHRTLHYNAQGQIGAVEEGGTLLARYAYNGARQRVAKTVYQGWDDKESEATTYFTWHRGLLDAELDEHGRVQRRYIYLNLRAVALLEYGYGDNGSSSRKKRPESTQRYAVHGDHLGTPQAITDEHQRVVWLASYDAFGRASAQGLPHSELTAHNDSSGFGWIGTAHAAGSPDKPFEFHPRFAGQYEDAETGWHYNWNRYYEPETGRYLTPDPIGLRGGDNAFGYAGGDPLGALDPWGLYVYGVFNVETGLLTLYDLETGLSVRGTFESGGRPYGDAIPNGIYDILEHPDIDFFRLESVDSSYGDDVHEDTGRNQFRLHRPGLTIGCIAATEADNWTQIRDFI